MAETTGKNTYITLHKNFVRTDIVYTDHATGETRAFNQATLPRGTTIDGRDVGGYQFSPLFVNESRFRGPDWRDIPLLTEREVWLQKSILDAEGNPVTDEEGRRCKDTVKVSPQQIRDALSESRRAYAEAKGAERGLADKAEEVRSVSAAMENGSQTPAAREIR